MKIIAVNDEKQLDRFLQVPAQIYQNNSYWVEPLRSSIKEQLASDNTFSEYGEHQPFIAVDESGKLFGRIVPCINQRLIAREKQQIGLFGYFECINDFQVAKSLLDGACQWLNDRQINLIRGPIDLSTHNNCLLLVDGFDSVPMIMMPYNQPYYPQLLEKYGFTKAKDAYAYDLPLNQSLSPKFAKGYHIACNSGIKFRSLRLKGAEFETDCRRLYQLFNTTFADNWSSTPRTEAEFLAEAKDLQSLVDGDIFIIAEDKGEMIGFVMGLPDYNIALQKVNGKLDWLGILKFLWYRRQIDRLRVIAICSLREYRRKMVSLALIYLAMQGATKKGKPYGSAELSWVWEDNYPSRKLIEEAGGKINKTYRIYQKSSQ